MSVNNLDADVRAVADASSEHASELLTLIVNRADSPMVAMTSLILATAVFAKSVTMSRESLLEGITAAFNSVEEVPHATH